MVFSLFGSCDRQQSRFLKRLHLNGDGPCFSVTLRDSERGRAWMTLTFFFCTDLAPRAMQDDDFAEEVTHKSTSKAKSVSKSDAQFVPPRPVTPKKEKPSGRVTDSENSTRCCKQFD